MRTVPSLGDSGGELRIVASSCNRYFTGDNGFLGLDAALPLSAFSDGVIESASIAEGDFVLISLSPTV